MSAYLRRFASSLDSALGMSRAQLEEERGEDMAPPQRARRAGGVQHVFSVTLVRGTPFYGYHADEQAWIKILL